MNPSTKALKHFRVLSFLLIVFTISATARFGQTPGSPDLAFGNNGVTNTPVWPGWVQYVYDVVIQPDGKTLTVGWNSSGQVDSRFMLTRFNADGSLDESFANNGITAEWLGAESKAYSAAVLSGGGIIVVGELGGNLAIARYSPNGMRRYNFAGAKGLRIIDLAEPGFTSNDLPSKIVLRPDGGFFVVSVRDSYATGTNPNFSQSSIVVTSHASNGMLDPTYASGGKLVKELPLHNYYIWNVKVEQDGTMFVHANGSDRRDWTNPDYQPPSENITLKFGPNGLPNNAFGKNGSVRSTTSAVNRVLRVLPDGNMLASNGYRVVRMNAAGLIEAEIINAQQITVNGQPFTKRSYLAQPDGKIITQGILPDSQWRLAFVRFLPTGEIDSTFGINGLALGINAYSGWEHQFLLQNDGKILHVGQSSNIILSRYHGGQ
jgi:uncharacterized delta-60 repeat protein